MSGKIDISRELAREILEQMENDWQTIDGEWGPTIGGLDADIADGNAEPIRKLRALLATPAVERQPVDAILLEDCEEITVQDYGRGYFATDDCVRQLYASPPAPVAVVLPEWREQTQENPYLTDADHEWNACLDKVKELNQ